MEEIWGQVGNLGFPVVLSIYLLVRIEKKLDMLTEAINNLGRAIEK
jgi:hypothetical protein